MRSRKKTTSMEKAVESIGAVLDEYRKSKYQETHDEIKNERDFWKRIYYELKDEHDKLAKR